MEKGQIFPSVKYRRRPNALVQKGTSRILMDLCKNILKQGVGKGTSCSWGGNGFWRCHHPFPQENFNHTLYCLFCSCLVAQMLLLLRLVRYQMVRILQIESEITCTALIYNRMDIVARLVCFPIFFLSLVKWRKIFSIKWNAVTMVTCLSSWN